MCETGNLIDLTELEDANAAGTTPAHQFTASNLAGGSFLLQQNYDNNLIDLGTSPAHQFTTSNLTGSSFLLQQSFENNPFDSMQNLAQRHDNPFDIAERSACAQAVCQMAMTMAHNEVKVGQLLSIEDDVRDSLDGGGAGSPNVATNAESAHNQSPQIAVADKHTPDSGSNTDGGETSAKHKRSFESRKHLLKLSITNSTFNTPISRQNARQTSGESFPENDSSCYSPISTLYAQIAQGNESMLEVESPLKLVDDDDDNDDGDDENENDIDLLAEEPPIFADAEKDYDADLEMLKIPMLNELSTLAAEKANVALLEQPAHAQTVDTSAHSSVSDVLPDLVALRAKLSAKRAMQLPANAATATTTTTPTPHDTNELMQHLKTLLCELDIDDVGKKQKATALLESLCSAVTTSERSNAALSVPQAIVRQGTFDLDIQAKQQIDVDNPAIVQPQGNINLGLESIPDAMLKSSATYDCEPPEEKDSFHLSECEASPPPPPPAYTHSPQANVNELVDQLTKLLEQNFAQNGHNQRSSNTAPPPLSHGDERNAASAIIVVMPPPSSLPAYMLASRESSPDFQIVGGGGATATAAANMRRRSQSLSSHDKARVTRMHAPTTSPMALNVDAVAAVTPPNAVEFKTPMRTMPRRNSFSSSSPYTTVTVTRNSAISRRSYVNYDAVSNLSTSFSRSASSSTSSSSTTPVTHSPHAEKKRLTPGNLHLFKPDLKKKTRTTHPTTSSILKCSAPLKATIPMKRVAPMIKVTTAATAADTQNSSIGLAAAASAATKMSASYPNACSTPRPGLVTRTPASRYSNTSTTATTATRNALVAANTARDVLSKRRSVIAEHKKKSPMKSVRHSVAGVTGNNNAPDNHNTKATNARGTAASRLATAAHVSRMPGKSSSTSLSASSSNNVAATNRSLCRRVGGGGGGAAALSYVKCKENMKP